MNHDISIPNGQIVDLTHDYSAETIYWPTEDGFKLEIGFEGDRKSVV